MRRLRKAKIVATLGPASSDALTITALFEAGADVFRFNFSHGSHEDHRARYDIVRAIEKKMGRPIAILADLQGPKLRVGQFVDGCAMLVADQRFVLDQSDQPGDATRVGMPHPELFAVITPGQTLLLDDGKLRLAVEESDGNRIVTRVVVGGMLSNRKGVNVPDVIVPIPALTDKDRRDLDFALSLGVDWIALSFVQQVSDVLEARAIVGQRAGILSKIEKPAALKQLDDIIRASDAVMVARGDLGVELPAERVPREQKRILSLARKHGKPVVVATQMLESMIESPVPTRAEASDVATAIYDGADAVMLSAESASGNYPLASVSMMNRIIEEVESDPLHRTMLDAQQQPPLPTHADAICSALRDVIRIINAVASVSYTFSGHTALRAARERPSAPILCITPNLQTARKMALTWGVHATVIADVTSVEDMVSVAVAVTRQEGFGLPGQSITISAGMPFGEPGTTNLLRIATISDAIV
ncbi:pyruvate kinase [Actimicrobium antarcticum]|uniref:Pyruvate kinase n=1 Tax=Actimicrobium antarcticum TaxID=1051899 RepID=A0ABP7TIR8_9BURK